MVAIKEIIGEEVEEMLVGEEIVKEEEVLEEHHQLILLQTHVRVEDYHHFN